MNIFVRLYLEVKKHEPKFAMYLLCIDTTNKKTGQIHCFDGTSVSIICVEGLQKDAQTLIVVE
ncbi:hypothetical protein H5410_001800 [Solanum commersonii]|uniref:Uncharacterized protein n=1 Tax=Solanum commersonii TaxID=4109 RepID=A0A9J6B0L8_SOLCO|nr:hypothetical protein H5410_001800 [Solanum commersonii]